MKLSNRNHDLVVPVLDYSRASVSRSRDKGNAGPGNEIVDRQARNAHSHLVFQFF